MTINLPYLSHLFNNNEMYDACKRMTSIYREIMEDAPCEKFRCYAAGMVLVI